MRELTDNDRERIEQEWQSIRFSVDADLDEKAIMLAEYATRYEREQHSGRHTDNYLKLHKDYMKLKKQVSQLEVERTELRNKVIEEMNVELTKIAAIPDWLLKRITRHLNSLKK